MDFTTFAVVLCLLQIICTIVGSKGAKEPRGQEGYFLANKSIRCFPLVMTFVATQIGGCLILGAANEAYQYGWSVLLYPLGQSLGFVFLACGIGKKLAEFKVSTIAELLEVVYKSKKLKQIASLLSILSLFMLLIAQVMASNQFFVSLGMMRLDVFILFWAIAILYTTARGLAGIIAVDIVQASFFITVLAACFASLFIFGDFSFPALLGEQEGILFDMGTTQLTGWLLMPLLFMVVEQDMAQRCFAAKAPAIVGKAAGWSALCTFAIGAIPVCLGMLGRIRGIPIEKGASTLMTVIQELCSPQMAAFVGCAVLMAIVSTAVSLINAISSNITQDFSFAGKTLRTSRGITVAIAALALLFSFFFEGIVALMIQSYELCVSCFFVPVLMAILQKTGDKRAAYLAISFGAIGFVAFHIIKTPIPKEISSLILSAIGYGAGALVRFPKKLLKEY